MFIKSHKLAHYHSTILDGNTHPIVYKLKHLATFGRHDCESSSQQDALKMNLK
jgi:hypothetical protein